MSEADRLQAIGTAHSYLCAARAFLVKAGAKKTAGKVRLALRSCDGAIRNRRRFAWKEEVRK